MKMLSYKKSQLGTTLNWAAALILIFFILFIYILIGLLLMDHSNVISIFEPENKLIEKQRYYLESKSEVSLIELKEVTSMGGNNFDSYAKKIKSFLNEQNG